MISQFQKMHLSADVKKKNASLSTNQKEKASLSRFQKEKCNSSLNVHCNDFQHN